MKSALETILVKSEDLDLAFLVARLMESPSRKVIPAKSSLSMLGGGGGFASAPIILNSAELEQETAYRNWQPKLGKMGRWLLKERGLEYAEDDPCLKALQYMWLGTIEQAGGALAHLEHKAEDLKLMNDMVFPTSFDTPLSNEVVDTNVNRRTSFHFHAPQKSTTKSANDRVLNKTNDVLDFVSRPFLIKAMGGSFRTVWATTLLTSRAMLRRGIELSAARCVLQTTDISDHDEVETPAASKDMMSMNGVSSSTGTMQSSIFDSFGTAPPKPPVVHQQASSIFDSFAPAPQIKPKTKEGKPSEWRNDILNFRRFRCPPSKA